MPHSLNSASLKYFMSPEGWQGYGLGECSVQTLGQLLGCETDWDGQRVRQTKTGRVWDRLRRAERETDWDEQSVRQTETSRAWDRLRRADCETDWDGQIVRQTETGRAWDRLGRAESYYFHGACYVHILKLKQSLQNTYFGHNHNKRASYDQLLRENVQIKGMSNCLITSIKNIRIAY